MNKLKSQLSYLLLPISSLFYLLIIQNYILSLANDWGEYMGGESLKFFWK